MTSAPHNMTIAIVGPGRVGGMLMRLVPPGDVRVVIGRTQVEQIPPDALAEVTLLIFTVPDDALPDVAARLAARLERAPDGAIALHTSGAMSADVLAPLRACGYSLASLHPLKTIPAADASDTFAGTHCAVEGDEAALPAVMEFVRAIGGLPFTLPAGGKARYHAAAAIACNYLVTLQAEAAALIESLGVAPADALNLLLPLVHGTVDALAERGVPGALTGPIERGDIATIRAHLAALPPDTQALYRELGRRTVSLALRKGSISDATAAALRDALTDRDHRA